MRCLVLALTLILAYSPSAMAQRDKFNETHSEMFVFVEKADSLKEYGYRGFCKNTRTFACMNRLSYRDYLGKRGHFLSMEPVARASGYEFREVILETGEKYFFVAKPHKGNILGAANGDISFVSDIEAGQSELGKPIVDGSPVSITRVKRQYGWTLYYTNDGEPLKDEELDVVRSLLNSLNTREYDKELLELFQVSTITWDRIEQRYVIRIAPSYVDNDAGPIRATVVKTGSSVGLSGTARYSANDWLFVDRYVVVAGTTRYESPSLEFRRDHTGGKVWEWTSFTVGPEKRKLFDSIATNADAVVRFYGRNYYADKEMSAVQRDALSKMLRLYDLLAQLSN